MISPRLILAGHFEDLAQEAQRHGVPIVVVEDSAALIEAARSSDSVELVLISFFIPGSSAIDLVPTLRELLPDAKVWISTTQVSEDSKVDERWAHLCDRFVPYPPSWSLIEEG